MFTSFKTWVERVIPTFLIILIGNISQAQEGKLLSEVNVSSGLPSNTIRALKLDSQNKLWVGTDNGLAILNQDNKVDNSIIEEIGAKSIWAIDFIGDVAFLGTRYNGLYVINKSTGKLIQYYPSTIISEIRKIKIFGNAAFLLTNKGVSKWEDNKIITLPIVNSAGAEFIIDMFQLKGVLYGLAYPSRQIQVYKSESFQITDDFPNQSYFKSNILFSAFVDKDTLLLGSSSGSESLLLIIDKNKNIHEYKGSDLLGFETIIWQIGVFKNMYVLAAGNTTTNQSGALFISSKDSVKLESKLCEYVTCFEFDTLTNSVYYGTLNKGIFIKKIAITCTIDNSIGEEAGLFNNSISGSKINPNPIVDNIIKHGDTTICVYSKCIKVIEARSKRILAVINNDNAYSFNYVSDAHILKDKLYLFSSYGSVYKYDFNNGKKSVLIGINSFLPYVQRFNNDIFLLNREKEYIIINNSEAYSLKCADKDIAFAADFTVINDTLYTLSKGGVKCYWINRKRHTLNLINQIHTDDLVKGFIPKWIDSYGNQIILMNNQGLLFLDKTSKLPINYFYLGNYSDIEKPVLTNEYLIVSSGTYSERIPLTYFENERLQEGNEEIRFEFPESLYENTEFNIWLHQSPYLLQNHFLKQVNIWQNGRIINTYYFLQDRLNIPNGLKYGSYRVELKIGKTSKIRNLSISLPLSRNPYFFIIISVFLLLIVILIAKVLFDKRRLKEKTLRNKMLFLNQNFNPHFVYNSMNLISSLILEEKYDDAIQVVSDFSKLQRTFLETNNKESISLQEELNFLDSYLKLQKRRFEYDSSFEYSISITDPEILNKIKLPPFILQPLVENAIKYGIIGSKSVMKWIRIEIGGVNPLVIGIEDNGENVDKGSIGLKLGHKLVMERVNLYNSANESKITLHFTLPVHTSHGFRVEVHIT